MPADAVVLTQNRLLVDSSMLTAESEAALVPEALLPTVMLSLALGPEQMSKRQIRVRNLEAVETLGSTGWHPPRRFPPVAVGGASGAALIAIVFAHTANVFACRSSSRPLWGCVVTLGSMRPLWGCVVTLGSMPILLAVEPWINACGPFVGRDWPNCADARCLGLSSRDYRQLRQQRSKPWPARARGGV
ncbi:Na,H/K antiporter P-type ATPase, alpha subunit [Mycobacterium basiliense]|uniref:Na,H/K antiporter P-type ATPase, alpha subunit n=1 Tax=Mycobacterium basiliense TaxID=2094119 RepID=A0A447GGM2_9MYCO|nr:cation-translocating P-type ATPase [Mycobacterium basiliense]VDM89622.1 Na,H/K antiporter P-type ATPase, alpha subunit [Mycobacterium basiliense]